MSAVVTTLAALGATLSVAFVIVYARRPWWASPTGRILMVTVAVLGVLFVLRVFARTAGSAPEWLWAAGYLILDGGLFGLLWLLWRGDRSPGERT